MVVKDSGKIFNNECDNPDTFKMWGRCMKTAEREISVEPAMTLCHILAMPIKRRLAVIALILFSMALCVVVFAA
jgi:hypothetical protein